MSLTTLELSLGERSYPIHIGSGLLEQHRLITAHLRGDQVLIVSNDRVAPLYLGRVRKALARQQVKTLVLADGEQHKTLETAARIFDYLLEQRFARDCTIIALGGGVVGDITGFAAACYQRGVDYIQAPTTLLAQVDSSVGGKTGVNHPLGKNMIGAFHQPTCVVTDTATLATLPDRELAAGLAEVIKYGLIGDSGFFDWLELNLPALLQRDDDALIEAIERSCRNKAGLVSGDERESGARALLNLGHTFGHAIETAMGYGNWLHGEAVAAGTMMAADLSRRLGWLDGQTVARMDTIYRRAGLPVRPPTDMSPRQFLHYMSLDKKIMGGRLRLVLLESLGRAVITADYPADALQATLTECCSHQA